MMALKVGKVDTWAAAVEDQPGALAAKLGDLARAGINLEMVIGRRASDRPGTGVVFVAPITGATGCRAARRAGFEKTKAIHSVRIEGPDKPGQGARITQALAEKRLNLRGLAAAAIGKKFLMHIALDRKADAAKVVRILRAL